MSTLLFALRILATFIALTSGAAAITYAGAVTQMYGLGSVLACIYAWALIFADPFRVVWRHRDPRQ